MKFNDLVNRKRSGRYWLWFLVEDTGKEKAEIWGELVTKSKPGNWKNHRTALGQNKKFIKNRNSQNENNFGMINLLCCDYLVYVQV
jgi:hypothetical protein